MKQVQSIYIDETSSLELLGSLIRDPQNQFFYISLKEELESSSFELLERVIQEVHQERKRLMLSFRKKVSSYEADAYLGQLPLSLSKEEHLKVLETKKPYLLKISGTREEIEKTLKDLGTYFSSRSFTNAVFLLDTNKLDIDSLCIPEGVNVILTNTPSCVAKRKLLPNMYKSFFDVRNFVEGTKDVTEEVYRLLLKEYVKTSKCQKCPNTLNCFGIQRNNINLSKLSPLTPEESSKPKTIVELCLSTQEAYKKSLSSRKLTVGVRPLGLKAETEEERLAQEDIINLQNCRKGDLSGEDFFRIQTYKESMFFNRPFEEVELFSPDPRGLNSVNWIFIGKDRKDLSYKMKQDLLLPHHGFTLTCKVLFDDSWTEEEKEELDSFSMKTLMDIILENGGDPNLLEQKGNDLLYQGRKFCGQEWKFSNKFYIENTVITTEYLPEKQWFDKLYHYKGEKQITGITEEVPGVTKELLINELIKRFKERFSEHIKH